MQAKDFKLPDQNGRYHSLAQYKGKRVVLYFYPKDDTPGCTREACGFRDNFQELTDRGVVILGVSKDSVASHKKFAKKYHLDFPLLSDTEKKVIRDYGAWGKKKFLGREFEGVLRKTYLIGSKGEIFKIYENVNPQGHAQEILKDFDLS